MSTFTLPSNNSSSSRSTPTTVSIPAELTQQQLLSFPAFNNWLETLQHNLSLQGSNKQHEFYDAPYELKSITVQAVDWFGHGRMGFLKMTAEIKNEKGERLPGSVFLRGGSVGMLVILQPDDVPEGSEEEKHVLLTIQPRIAAGSLAFPELPAGMVDDGTFAGAAAKEIEEELGLSIPEDQLINLTELAIPPNNTSNSNGSNNTSESSSESLPRAIFPSAGGCDEYIPIFMHLRRVPREQLNEWTGKLTGLRDEGERITLKLVPFGSLWKEGARDAKALCAWGLYCGLKSEGKI